MTESAPTRRERLRAQTLGEIKQHALDQVGGGGAAALSLNAIAKAMGMSGPAIYRYFDSREALLAALVTDGYAELAAVVDAAATASTRRTPARRLQSIGAAYRAWALANAYRYELLFSVRPDGYADPPEAIAAIEPAMQRLLEVIGAAAGGPDPGVGGRLETQLDGWAASRGGDGAASPSVLLLGVLTWTRLHGIVTLELAGALGDMGLDGALLVEHELNAVLAAAPV